MNGVSPVVVQKVNIIDLGIECGLSNLLRKNLSFMIEASYCPVFEYTTKY